MIAAIDKQRPDSPDALARIRGLGPAKIERFGEDLLAAGLSEGPEIGRRLEAVLELRLDGRLPDGREAELQAALGLPMPEENGAGGLA